MIKPGTNITFILSLTNKEMEGKFLRYITRDKEIAEVQAGDQKYFCVSTDVRVLGVKLNKNNPNVMFKRKG